MMASILSVNILAASKSPMAPVTRIQPMMYQGEPGFFVNNCNPIGSACITEYAGAGPTGIAYWVSQNNPLYKIILSVSLASLASGAPVQLHGSGTCIPACGNGYERIGWVDFRK